MTSIKPFKRENQRSNLYKTRHIHEPHQQTTTTEHKVPDLGQEQTGAAGLNVFIGTNLHPNMKQ